MRMVDTHATRTTRLIIPSRELDARSEKLATKEDFEKFFADTDDGLRHNWMILNRRRGGNWLFRGSGSSVTEKRDKTRERERGRVPISIRL